MQLRILIVPMAASVWFGSALGCSGSCALWAMKNGDFVVRYFSGDQAGYSSALSYVGTSGIIQINAGCSGIDIGTPGDSVVVLMKSQGAWTIARGPAPDGRATLEVISKASNPNDPTLGLRPKVNDGRTQISWLARNPPNLGYRAYGSITAAGVNGGNPTSYMSWYTSRDTLQSGLQKRMDMGADQDPSFLNWVNFKNVRYYSPSLNAGGFTLAILESLMYAAGDTTTWAGPIISLAPRGQIHWRSNAFPWTTYPMFQKDNKNNFFIADVNTPRVIISPNGLSAAVFTGISGTPGVRCGDAVAPSSYYRLEVGGSGTGAGNLKVEGAIHSTGSTFANLGNVLSGSPNGTIIYCSDCTKATPCAGSGTGAIAKRINGAWDCN